MQEKHSSNSLNFDDQTPIKGIQKHSNEYPFAAGYWSFFGE
jgi:hypothetical protein